MKTYKGKRTMRSADVTVTEVSGTFPLQISPSLKVRNHSPTGFEWGYNGSGPAQLALAILLDHFEMSEAAKIDAERLYQSFKNDVISQLPATDWMLTSVDIDGWLNDPKGFAEILPALLRKP